MENVYWFAVLVCSNGLLILLLALHVSRLRVVKRIPYGDGNDTGMNQAIRAHANALEHVTLFALVILGSSLLGSASGLAALVIVFTLSRVIHAYGMLARVFNARRVGAGITYLVELAALVMLGVQLF